MRTPYFENLLQYLPQEEQQQLQQAFGASDTNSVLVRSISELPASFD